jgi:predicted signal transduction protein with EAL and GGDEF domain
VHRCGTGYSSLTHLSELPIQQLKIDRSFVSQIHDRSRDAAIVKAVAELARHLDIEVVAEGIETTETAVLLRDLGCANGQGHHFAQSMAAELLPVWVSTRPQPTNTIGVGTPRSQLLRRPLDLRAVAALERRTRVSRAGGARDTLVQSVIDEPVSDSISPTGPG